MLSCVCILLILSDSPPPYSHITSQFRRRLCRCKYLQLVIRTSSLMPSSYKQQKEKFETARFELHQLLAQPSLTQVPLLVVSVPNVVPPRRITGWGMTRATAWEQERP